MKDITRVYIPYELSPGVRDYIGMTFRGAVSRKKVRVKVRDYIHKAFGVWANNQFMKHEVIYEWPSDTTQEMSKTEKMAAFNRMLDQLHQEGLAELEKAESGRPAESSSSTPEVAGGEMQTLSNGFNGQAGRSVR